MNDEYNECEPLTSDGVILHNELLALDGVILRSVFLIFHTILLIFHTILWRISCKGVIWSSEVFAFDVTLRAEILAFDFILRREFFTFDGVIFV